MREFQALAFHKICNITHIVLYDVDAEASEKAKRNLEGVLDVKIASSIQDAVSGAHIITTCTNVETHACLIRDEWLHDDVHINAIGGDRPGKTELDPTTIRRADVYVEYEPQTRVEGEIQRTPECAVTEIHKLFQDHPITRSKQITIFDSVGFALEDFAILTYMYDIVGGQPYLKFIPETSNPKDLYSIFR